MSKTGGSTSRVIGRLILHREGTPARAQTLGGLEVFRVLERAVELLRFRTPMETLYMGERILVVYRSYFESTNDP